MKRLFAVGLAISIAASAAGSGCREEVPSVMQREFSWVIPDRLAGMPRPGRDAPIDADAAFLKEKGIALVVTLTEEPLPAAPFSSRGIRLAHMPVRDFFAPTVAQLVLFADRAATVIDQGGRVAVHCAYGKGRTGTFLAAYLVATGMTAEAAIAEVRRLRPGSIETAEQVAAIRDFEVVARHAAPPAGD